MDLRHWRGVRIAATLLSLAWFAMPATAQLATPRQRIRTSVDNGQLQILIRNTHPLARAQFDQGAAPDDLPMDRMLMVLSRSADQNAALDTLLAQQQDPTSPQYHHWLSPTEFGAQFGAADADIQTITNWLQSFGFQVNRISNGRSVIEFSGTAGQVAQAFHTSIHKYVVNGATHWANATNPQIPTALASVVTGITTMHNFQKQPQLIASGQTFEANASAGSRPQYTSSNGTHALAPADYALIYNINPLYQANIDGSGVTIAVVGRTNINVSDIAQFRSTFGLSANTPTVVVNGRNPGNLGSSEQAEAVLDTTWSGAVAPGAAVKLVISASTNTTDGVDLSEEYIIDNNLGDVMTESFGDCEANYTQAEAQFYSSLAQQAAAQGISYTVASGDAGTAGCNSGSDTTSTGQVSVNVLASNPYVIAVGGTEFNESAGGGNYWNSTNGTNDVSVLSYIPEEVWNESCTSSTCTSGNSPGLWASGGGASSVFSKPSWQTGVPGIPSDGARDVPDVALTAAGHDAYLLCVTSSCSPNGRGRISFQGYGGTSAATPSFAGILALVNQKTGSRQGQANVVLYRLAAAQNWSACGASNGIPPSNCIFNDVTVGNNSVPGQSDYGTSSPLYQAGVGYDLATGLGSTNVANLVNGWAGASAQVEQVRVGIDVPSAANSVVLGVTTFSGWAVDDAGAVTTVAVTVDGAPLGNATYGLGRADVCTSYPGRAGCPNVGWSYSLDTTLLASGTHSLQVTANSSAGRTFTIGSTFTVANWTTANPMRIGIDAPNAQSAALSGSAGFSGWAISDLAGISNVAVLIDGASFGSATYGASRPDVCTAYPNRAGCPNVGWTFTLDTTLLADGQHTVTIVPTSTGGQHSTASTSFTVSNAASSAVTLYVDTPSVQSGVLSGLATFGGWALANTGTVTSLAVAVDGVPYGNAVYGLSRPDVCNAYPNRGGCPNVGWTMAINTEQLANGMHTLEVTGYGNNGQHATVSRAFQVVNTAQASPVKVYIDQPNSQTAVLLGGSSFSGWALDANAAVGSVAIAIDGIPKGTASYGSSRPDVCAAYAGSPGCPNVGWTYPIDTTLLTDGQHTLAVTATSSANANEQWTASTTFNVANWTTSNPMRISVDTPSGSGTLTGTVNFGGWALDDAATIGTVAIAVDGVPYGKAQYGANRPDVCAVYPGRANCPNAGWNFSFNTALLADGSHTLDVTGTTTAGRSSTTTTAFTTGNVAASAIKIGLDRPAPNTTLSGVATIGGWALDTSAGTAISSVQILVDGAMAVTAGYGVSRVDVCTVYSGASGCPNVGWSALLDTTVLANGTHKLEVRAIAANAQQLTVSAGFNVANVP